MLVAGPSHSSYAYTSNSVASRDNSHGSSSTSNSSKYSLMKTFAEHINRGTELFKQTVQKAILPKATQSVVEQPLILSPGKCHRSLSLESDSGDSLKLEMCHFKPIRTMPTTPKRRNVNTRLKFPTAKKTYIGKNVYNLGPTKSTYKPLQNRSSAFSSLTVPEILPKPPSPLPVPIPRATRKRKTNNDSCPVPIRKSCRTQVINKAIIIEKPKIIPKKQATTNRQKKTVTNNKIEQYIATTTEKKILQEKQDLEYAKKLQNELNDDGDSETVPNRVYSLRRKTIKPIEIKLTKNKKSVVVNVNENIRKSKRRR